MTSTDITTSDDVELTINYVDEDNVTITISGFEEGVTVLHALAQVGSDELIAVITSTLTAKGDDAYGQPINIDLALDNGDVATVTASGFLDPRRGIAALASAGSMQIFAQVVEILALRGDTSVIEFLEADDEFDDAEVPQTTDADVAPVFEAEAVAADAVASDDAEPETDEAKDKPASGFSFFKRPAAS